MQFDLAALLPKIEGLDNLTLPFQAKEMDEVVQNMLPDHAPGPDGFNDLFLKRCWSIIKHDFY
jgi:hypothetical protein